jgi:hypothetical protein
MVTFDPQNDNAHRHSPKGPTGEHYPLMGARRLEPRSAC